MNKDLKKQLKQLKKTFKEDALLITQIKATEKYNMNQLVEIARQNLNQIKRCSVIAEIMYLSKEEYLGPINAQVNKIRKFLEVFKLTCAEFTKRLDEGVMDVEELAHLVEDIHVYIKFMIYHNQRFGEVNAVTIEKLNNLTK